MTSKRPNKDGLAGIHRVDALTYGQEMWTSI